MKHILFIGGGVLMALLITLVVIEEYSIKEARHDFVLGNGFTLIFATKKKIQEIEPTAFMDNTEDLVVHRGWFRASEKRAIIYSLHPNAVTPLDVAMFPGLFIQACHGTLAPADTAPLSPEARLLVGAVFHELIGHGSDSFDHGRPLHMINALWPWPSTPDPGEENPQNPWKVVRKYWPLHATHPELEELEYK